MRRIAIGLATGGLALCASAPATAATTVGSPRLATVTEGVAACETCPAAILFDRVDGVPMSAPAGVVVRFRVKASGPVTLVAYRPSDRTPAHLAATRVGVGATATGAGNATIAETATRVPVAAGDLIGISIPSGSKLSTIATPEGDTHVWTATDGATIDTTSRESGEVLYQADIEADADGDGFGDETQDACVGQAGAQNGCAAPPPPPPPPPAATPTSAAELRTTSTRITKAGSVRVLVHNPNKAAITGTLALKRRGKTVAKGAFTLAPGAFVRVSMKLAKSLRREMRNYDWIRLPLTVTTRVGTTTRSATKSLMIRRR